MGLEARAKAAAKSIEGKVQESLGNLAGDQQAQVVGKAKQVEARVLYAKENLKDAVKRSLDRI